MQHTSKYLNINHQSYRIHHFPLKTTGTNASGIFPFHDCLPYALSTFRPIMYVQHTCHAHLGLLFIFSAHAMRIWAYYLCSAHMPCAFGPIIYVQHTCYAYLGLLCMFSARAACYYFSLYRPAFLPFASLAQPAVEHCFCICNSIFI